LKCIIPFEIFEFICTSNFTITLCLAYYFKYEVTLAMFVQNGFSNRYLSGTR
jgi:hypothetical protein